MGQVINNMPDHPTEQENAAMETLYPPISGQTESIAFYEKTYHDPRRGLLVLIIGAVVFSTWLLSYTAGYNAGHKDASYNHTKPALIIEK